MTHPLQENPDFLGRFFVNHRLFHSTKPDETVQQCTRALGSHRMWVHAGGNGLNSKFNGIVCNDFAIVRVSHGYPVTIEPQVADEYIVHHKLTGSGVLQNDKVKVNMTSGVIAVTSPGQLSKVEMDSHSLNIVVRLSRKKVQAYVQNMLQQTVKQSVVFDLCMIPHGPAAASWFGAVQHVCDQYDVLKRNSDVGPGVEVTFAEYMISLLLQIQPHNYSSRLADQAGQIPLHYVRKARDYIHGHVSEHISMATLAQVSGVSARSLQAGFSRCFGQTPMEYVREQRLRCVHEELLGSGPEIRITDVFMKFGIYDFGRYARFYKERFGSLPSEHKLRQREN